MMNAERSSQNKEPKPSDLCPLFSVHRALSPLNLNLNLSLPSQMPTRIRCELMALSASTTSA